MEIYLNQYGLIAVKLNSQLTLDSVAGKLNIDLISDDRLMLVQALKADEDRIGLYNDNLLICVNNIFTFFNEQLGEFATKLLTSFNKEKICAVYYYSVPDLFGYSYFENGQRIRTKYGELDNIRLDIGEVLPIEQDIQPQIEIDNWLVQQITGEKLTILTGKQIEMTKFR